MKRILILIAVCLSVAFALPQPVKDAVNSAVRIYALTLDGERPICSGAVVQLPEGPRVVSAGHCVVDGFTRYRAEDAEGGRYFLHLERYAFSWPQADYAVFRSTAQYFLPALPMAKTLEVGQDAYAYSAPLGFSLFLARGYVAGVLHNFEPDDVDGFWLVDLNADGGSSGSVIVNAQGEALGILVGAFSTQIKLGGSIMAPLP